MGIYITPLQRITALQQENARLRSLVGEPAVLESEPLEGEQAEPAPTIVSRVGTVEETIDVLFGGAV